MVVLFQLGLGKHVTPNWETKNETISDDIEYGSSSISKINPWFESGTEEQDEKKRCGESDNGGNSGCHSYWVAKS